MNKIESLIKEYNELKSLMPSDEYYEELADFVKTASIHIWAANGLYSGAYATALDAIPGRRYTREQIMTEMDCCDDEGRKLGVPEFMKSIAEDKETSDKFILAMNDLLYSMGMVNGDFTINEAIGLGRVMKVLMEYVEDQGLTTPEIVIEHDMLTKLKRETYECGTEKEQVIDIIEAGEDTSAGEHHLFKLDDNGNLRDADVTELNNTDKGLGVKNLNKTGDESLESLLTELDNLVGLEDIKRDVHSLVNFLKIAHMRKERGMKVPVISHHLVFTGNPGTGKTTVARLVARIYYQMGILPRGQFVETDRSSLVAGYLGQTALKTQEVIKRAMGGVLFIDEAYSLAGGDEDFYGKEAVETILKAMEDHRDELVVIVAGYTELMHKFIDSNPGLSSRFNKYFEFQDYDANDLIAIFKRFCAQNGYSLAEDGESLLYTCFEELYADRDDHFGNARTARNIFEKAINAQADRIADMNDVSDEMLESLSAEDVLVGIGGYSGR